MPNWLNKFLASGLVYLFALLPMQGAVQEKPIPSHCQVAMAGLSGDGKDYFDNFVFPRVPTPAVSVVDAKLSNSVATFVVAPMDAAQFGQIFRSRSDTQKEKADVTKAQESEVTSIRSDLKGILGKDTSDSLNAKSVVDRIKADPATYVLLVGHNDSGNFRFADSTSAKLDEIVGGARPDQRVIFISCRAAEHITHQAAAGTSRELTYEEAFKIAKNIQSFIQEAGPLISLRSVRERLTTTEASVGFRYQVKYFAMKALCTGGTAVAVALVISALSLCLVPNAC